MPGPTPQSPPVGNGICQNSTERVGDFFIVNKRGIPATFCSESVKGSAFDQTITDYLDGNTELTYEFDDLEVQKPSHGIANNTISNIMGGVGNTVDVPPNQEVDFKVPADGTFKVDFQQKTFEENVTLGFSDDTAVDGLINEYCWANGLLQNNNVQYVDSLGNVYGPSTVSSFQSNLTDDLRDKQDKFQQDQEDDWMQSLNPDSSFNANDLFEFSSERPPLSHNFRVGNNFNINVGYSEATIGTFVKGADKTVTRTLSVSNRSVGTKGGNTNNSAAGTTRTTTPGTWSPTQGTSKTYSITASYKLNDNWVVQASYAKSDFDFDVDLEGMTDDCGFGGLPADNHAFTLSFTYKFPN